MILFYFFTSHFDLTLSFNFCLYNYEYIGLHRLKFTPDVNKYISINISEVITDYTKVLCLAYCISLVLKAVFFW